MHTDKEKKRSKVSKHSVFKKRKRIQRRNMREERSEGRIQQALLYHVIIVIPCNNCAPIYKSRRGEVTLKGEGQSKSFLEEVVIEIDLQGFRLINN